MIFQGNTQTAQQSEPTRPKSEDSSKKAEKGNEKSTQTDEVDQHSESNETEHAPEPVNNDSERGITKRNQHYTIE